MADISTYLRNIEEATLGEQVRGSIRDAISAINDAAEEGIEQAAARVGTPAPVSTVAEMEDTTKIYLYTGEETGYETGHWYYYDGSAWSDGGAYNSPEYDYDRLINKPPIVVVDDDTPEDSRTNVWFDPTGEEIEVPTMEEFEEVGNAIEYEYGKNRFDETAIIFGYIDSAGELIKRDDLDWYTSAFIPVDDLEVVCFSVFSITYNQRVRRAFNFAYFYDKDKQRIGTIPNGTYSWAVQTGTKYIRFAYHKNDTSQPQLEGASSFTDYEPYSRITLLKSTDYIRSSIYEETVNNISDLEYEMGIVSTALNERISPVFDDIEYTGKIGYYLNFDGIVTPVSSNVFYVTDPVQVLEGEQLFITARAYGSNCLYAFYDSNGDVVSYRRNNEDDEIIDEPVRVPSNAKAIRVEYRTEDGAKIKRPHTYEFVVPKIWEGKKWVCLGDSLTEVNRRTTMHYHDYIAEGTGITVINMGDSGSGYMKEADLGTAFYQRANNIPQDADVITIFGSGNDLSLIDSLGTPLDDGLTTICGCVNKTIDTIINIIPTVSLGIVAPTPWMSHQPTIDDTNSMARYTEALRNICKRRSIPFLDLYHTSNLRPWTEEGRNACYSKDDGNGTHPDEAGHKLIAPRFKAFLETLII